MVRLLAEEHRNLMVVGDSDQCLVEGTRVTMADGSRRAIETVEVGDKVLSCYGEGDFGPTLVERVHRSMASRGTAITTESGRRIVSTNTHVHFAGSGCHFGTPGVHKSRPRTRGRALGSALRCTRSRRRMSASGW